MKFRDVKVNRVGNVHCSGVLFTQLTVFSDCGGKTGSVTVKIQLPVVIMYLYINILTHN